MYQPRIYIRDYGEPTRRLLAFTGEYDFGGDDAETRRALSLRAESGVTGVDAIIFSGDAAPGALLLSGDEQSGADKIVTTNSAGFRVRAGEVTIRLGDILEPVAGAFTIAGGEPDLNRALTLHVEAGAFALTGDVADLNLGYIVRLEVGQFTLNGNAVSFGEEPGVALSGDAAPGNLALSGDAAPGNVLISETI